MANLCDVSMRLVGKSKDDLVKMVNSLQQKGDTWIGRGMCIDNDEFEFVRRDDTDEWVLDLYGYCKWSVQSSLFDNAYSMQMQIEGKIDDYWGGLENCKRSLQLVEYAKELGISVEYWSEETAIAFQEYGCYDADIDGFTFDEMPIEVVVDEETDEYDIQGGFDDYGEFTI